MPSSVRHRAGLHAFRSPTLLLPLLVALFWLALPAGRANAALITYDFTGTGNPILFPGITISGSFEVDTGAIGPGGSISSADMMNVLFNVSDTPTTNYEVVNPASTFMVDTTTFDVLSVNMTLTPPPPNLNANQLEINGTAGGGFLWSEVSEVSPEGPGTWTHTTGVAAVPAPPSFVLLGLGALFVGGYGWRRRRSAAA